MTKVDKVGEIGGQTVFAAKLENGFIEITLLSYGAITQHLHVNGRSVVLGYEKAEQYETDPYYMGAIVGRVANRIGGAEFKVDGQIFRLSPNEGENLLHGGVAGFSTRHWALVECSQTTATFQLESSDGDGGFPGALSVQLNVSLEHTSLSYEITANTTKKTPVSLTQHNYYRADLRDPNVSLHIASKQNLDTDAQGISTGALSSIPSQSWTGQSGIDTALIVNAGKVATLSTPDFDFDILTNQNCVQLYTGDFLGAPFRAGSGLCLEPQGYPNAVNRPEFPSIILEPSETYRYKKTLIFR